jgi:GNAT superfamily N-acetyltransferase
MSLQIEKVDGGSGLHEFVMFPWQVYKGDPYWVPPLINDTKKMLLKHPFLQHGRCEYYLCRRDGEIRGRIAYVVNDLHNETHEENIAFFGFFDCFDDPDVIAELFAVVERRAIEDGFTALRGPANFSSNEEYGLLVDGFDSSPAVMMTYNPKRYIDHIENQGYSKAKDLLAYYLDNPNPPDRVVRVAEKLAARKGVVVRTANMKRFKEEVEKVKVVYNNAWEKNWGFVPMTEAEVDHMAAELKMFLKPELLILAEKEGEPIGFAMALPELNSALKHANGRLFPFGLLKLLWHARKVDMLRVLTLGLIPEYRRTGIDQLLYLRLFQGAHKLNITRGEFSWILEDNQAMRQALEKMDCKVYKTYRIYEKPLR